MNDLAATSWEGDQELGGISLQVARESIVAVCGPNGGGKDALCRCLAGIQRPTRGTIQFNGSSLPQENWRAARKGLIVGLANNRVVEELSVKENLECSVPWYIRIDRKEAMDKTLDLFPVLRARLGQLAGTMSGGEQQMVALARAFLSGPQLVVLEEPWLGLAPKVIEGIFDHIRRMRDVGISFLLTEESVDRAGEYADCVYELSNGNIRSVN